MVIGLFGKACSGKNIVADYLVDRGYLLIDADKLGLEALVGKKNELVQAFGNSILATDGTIDRRKLGSIVFSHKTKLALLNSISHPYIVEQMVSIIKQNANKNIVINAALLPQWQINEVELLLEVRSHLLLRIIRSLKRDKRGLLFTLKRVYAQRKIGLKYFFKSVDSYSIRNDFSKEHLLKECEKLFIWLEETKH